MQQNTREKKNRNERRAREYRYVAVVFSFKNLLRISLFKTSTLSVYKKEHTTTLETNTTFCIGEGKQEENFVPHNQKT